jgi:pantetheine-phosphate adenylyltransferase
MQTIAVYPGTFDPVTLGHLDVIERAHRRFGRVIVAVSQNPTKEPLFDLDQRAELVKDAVADLGRVEVITFSGRLLVDVVADIEGAVLVKGLRAVTDFDYELQMAQMNVRLRGVETFFLAAAPEHSFLSSSLIREIARFGGDVSSFVTPEVARRLKEMFAGG